MKFPTLFELALVIVVFFVGTGALFLVLQANAQTVVEKILPDVPGSKWVYEQRNIGGC